MAVSSLTKVLLVLLWFDLRAQQLHQKIQNPNPKEENKIEK